LQRDLVTSAAHAYAGSVLGRMIRDLSTDPDQQDRFVVDDGGQT
jgi:acyl-CoA oxidase